MNSHLEFYAREISILSFTTFSLLQQHANNLGVDIGASSWTLNSGRRYVYDQWNLMAELDAAFGCRELLIYPHPRTLNSIHQQKQEYAREFEDFQVLWFAYDYDQFQQITEGKASP